MITARVGLEHDLFAGEVSYHHDCYVFFNLGVIGSKSGRPRDAALSQFLTIVSFPLNNFYNFFEKRMHS